MSEVELDHVQIVAPEGCEDDARAWFGGLLGLAEIEKPEPLTHVALRVGAAELDRMAGRLAAAGSPVIWDDALPGERRFYSADPWGNRIEFLAAP